MVCADCGTRAAAIFIRRSGGPEGDLALCEACARARGVVVGPSGLDLRLDGLIAAALNEDARRDVGPGEHGGGAARLSASPRVACPNCGTELSVIAREGRLGCARCVEAFRPQIGRLIASRDRASVSSVPTGSSELARALAEEDYEKAARIRDAKFHEATSQDSADSAVLTVRGPGAPHSRPLGDLAFPLCLPVFELASPSSDAGPEDDVVLWTSVRVSRNFSDLPFPGSPAGGPAPSRGGAAARFAALSGWKVFALADLDPAGRLALSELASLPRSYASDGAAAVAVCSDSPLYALEDETDHLRVVARRLGLESAEAAALALGAVERFAEGGRATFARDKSFGWICARIEDCGPGLSISTLVHLPALAMAGIQDRLFRRLMAEGVQVRGVYAGASADASAGCLYELVSTGATGSSPEELAAAAASSALAAAAAERRARSEIAHREPDAIADAAGRALGILSYCRRIGCEEAASHLSALRLAALAGSLRGIDARSLGRLFGRLGPGTLAAASGLDRVPDEKDRGILRAACLRAAVAGASLAPEEDRCSKD